MRQDDELFEQSLLLVLAEDPYYNGSARISDEQQVSRSYLRSMVQVILRGYSADRFFFMYRAHTYQSLQAYARLAPFYRRTQEPDRYLETSIMAAITAFSRIYEILLDRDLDYTYTTLDNFFTRVLWYTDIQEWITRNKVWECFLYLADAASQHGQQSLTRELGQLIRRYAPAHIVGLLEQSQ
jgi:hypothetical protein